LIDRQTGLANRATESGTIPIIVLEIFRAFHTVSKLNLTPLSSLSCSTS
jgi:hypothetical protein